jgi:ATP-dependent helicase HrpA
MAVELVETSRLWARTVAPIEAEWVEAVGGHLLKRTYSEPHWSARGGQCVAYERVTLLGVPIIAQRLVSYARIDPVVAREVFIQSALIEGQWRTRHHFWSRNQEVRAEAEQLADRNRRRDLLLDDASLAAFYADRIPDDVVSVAHFDRWWRDARRRDEHLLDLTIADLVAPDADLDTGEYPDRWSVAGEELPVDYAFDPGSGHDGVTVTVPLALLTRLEPATFTWQVPGLRADVATELIRALPKTLRTQLVPAPDTARRALAWLAEHPGPDSEPLWAALGRALLALTGVQVPAEAWRPDAVPDHLRVRFRVLGAGAEPVVGRDLADLGERLAPKVSRTLNAASSHLTHSGARSWEFGALPARISDPMPGFPALVDRVDRVGVQVFADAAEASRAHRNGLRRLIALTTVDPTRWVVSRMGNATKLALATSPYPDVPALLADARLKVIGDLADAVGHLDDVRDAEAFGRLADTVRADAAAAMQLAITRTGEILQLAGEVRRQLAAAPPATREDATEQLDGLLYRGFVAATPASAWVRLPVYLKALLRRLEASVSNPRHEAEGRVVIGDLEDEYARLCRRFPSGPLPERVAAIGWLLEELRVSLFAQALGTAVPVSAKRVRTAMAAAI